MKTLKTILFAALVAALAGTQLTACAGAALKDEVFSQVTDYDSVLQDDHNKSSWQKISREPSAIHEKKVDDDDGAQATADSKVKVPN